MKFALHWQGGREVTAIVVLDQSAGPYETTSVDTPEDAPEVVVPLALTYVREDFLRFLEARTRDATGEVKFAATQMGLDNLARLFPGSSPIDVTLPLPAVDPVDEESGRG